MTLLQLIEHWLATHDIVKVPEPLPPAEDLTMTQALNDVRQHLDEMHEGNKRLEEKVAIAEKLAEQQAIAHGFMPPKPGHPPK